MHTEPVSVLDIVLVTLVVAAGTTVQGTVGFGAALVAAPLLVLIEPTLVPGPISVGAIAFGFLMLTRETGAAHWEAIRWPAIGLLPGAIVGAVIVASLADRDQLTIFSATMVLVAVALSLGGLHPRRRPPQLLAGGAASGFMATSVGIGGPPVALFFQHASGSEIRGALARFFILSSAAAITLLAVVGRFGWHELGEGLLLVPGAACGFLLSGRLVGRFDRGHVRTAVLTLSTASAVAAIVRAAVT